MGVVVAVVVGVVVCVVVYPWHLSKPDGHSRRVSMAKAMQIPVVRPICRHGPAVSPRQPSHSLTVVVTVVVAVEVGVVVTVDDTVDVTVDVTVVVGDV